jgi:hypothetical protein
MPHRRACKPFCGCGSVTIERWDRLELWKRPGPRDGPTAAVERVRAGDTALYELLMGARCDRVVTGVIARLPIRHKFRDGPLLGTTHRADEAV